MLPGTGENIAQDEHRHVAADAVTSRGDGLEHTEHRLAGRSGAVIELDGVSPGGRVRVFAVGQPTNARNCLLAEGFRGRDRALHEQLRSRGQPGMIETHVVRNEIEQQAQSVFAKFLPENLEAFVATQGGRDVIISNGIRRAADIRFAPPGQRLIVGATQLRVRQRLGARQRSAGPNPHQPDMSEAEPPPFGEFNFRHIGQCDLSARSLGQLAQPAPGIDFVKEGSQSSKDHVFSTFSALAGLDTRKTIRPFLASGGVAL